jgi:hypothetical protein
MADNLADDDTGGRNNTNSNIPLSQKARDAATSASKPGESAVGGTIFLGQSSSSTTTAGKAGTDAGTAGVKKPDKRWKNPLANFSSYTYQISLYMITPDAYDAFIQSGRRDINAFSNAANSDAYNSGNGAYLICQSGGINNTSAQRAPGFDVDFFIDDLKITQAITGKDSGSATNVADLITFTITEPFGFSFISRLKKAQTALKQVTKSKNYQVIKNPLRQFFVLGVQFLGYDKDGNLINSKDIPGSDGDPQGNSYGLYQRYWDIVITSMKFKIEGKAVTYHIEAGAISGSAFGIKRGIIDQGAKVVGSTVYDALLGGATVTPKPGESLESQSGASSQSSAGESALGLLAKLNNDQAKRKAAGEIEIAATWQVTFLGEAESTIRNASILSSADLNKKKWPMTAIKQTSESTVAQERAASPNGNAREIIIPGGISILQAVNTIILQSSYMEDALRVIYTTDEQPKSDPDSGSNKILKWYTICAEIQVLGWDTKQSDFVYGTNYVIQPYETPVVISAYSKATTKYYGPHKRYEYWFTGKNSEILQYEQVMDNTYFTVALRADGSPVSTGSGTDSPVVVGKPQGQPDQGRLNMGLEAQSSYMTSLYDPAAYAEAKIRILGDPDFLMQTSTSSINALYNKFYGVDQFTVNPNGGQVFIEINFKEPTDYNNRDGLLGINESIIFWEYPEDVLRELNSRGGGVSYMLRQCVSTFRGGKFEQELTANINTFGKNGSKTSVSDAGRPSNGIGKPGETQMSDTASRTGSGTSSPMSVEPESTTDNDSYNDPMGSSVGPSIIDGRTTSTQTVTIPTNMGVVQDDDNSGQVNFNYF